MTVPLTLPRATTANEPGGRFRLNRAGILNVWQYDDQEFAFADGRLLLRGANGAGKSKTLEMLLPFALDGDKARITASAKHHTSLLWLMTDGFGGQARVGYVWVEFLRTDEAGRSEAYTCGVGIRASASQRTATAWHFATNRRIGHDLHLEDAAGPLSRGPLEEALGSDGQVFEKAAAYKDHVGRTLFGLDSGQYDEVLRLLYWLRQPQVGEDIEPVKLAQQLSQALPQLDEQAVRAAGDTFDELIAFGEQIERRAAAAEALASLSAAYATYARVVTVERSRAVANAIRTERQLRGGVRRAEVALSRVGTERDQAEVSLKQARAAVDAESARLRALEDSPEARDQRRLSELNDLAEQEVQAAKRIAERAQRLEQEHRLKAATVQLAAQQAVAEIQALATDLAELGRRHRESVPGSIIVVPTGLTTASLSSPTDASAFSQALESARHVVELARSAVTGRAAAVTAVISALEHVAKARRLEEESQRRAEDAENRWSQARERRTESEREVDGAESAYGSALAEWAAHPDAVSVGLPAEVTTESLDALPAVVRSAAAGRLGGLRSELQAELTRRDNASDQIRLLELKRSGIEAERDPAPPAPSLARTERTDGHALWQVIDFADEIDAPSRAKLEAALQAAGLLDAWVLPEGRLLSVDKLDTLLVGTTRAGETTLSAVLHVDLPAESDLTDSDVRAVLDSIHLGECDDHEVAVALDGAWRLGPAWGRATKEAAQYVGATARANERQRRLAQVDTELTIQAGARTAAQDAAERVQGAIDAVEAWVQARPADSQLRTAWTQLTLHVDAEQRDGEANRVVQHEAQRCRHATFEARNECNLLAGEHALPVDVGQLSALQERLRDLDDDLRTVSGREAPIARDLVRWVSDAGALAEQAVALAAEQTESASAQERANHRQIALDALREAVGSSVQELEAKVAQARRLRKEHSAAAGDLDEAARGLAEEFGVARKGLEAAQEQLVTHLPGVFTELASFAQLTVVPGLLAAADVADVEPFVQAGNVPEGAAIPALVVEVAQEMAGRTIDEIAGATTRVWRTYNEAANGPAADHQPTINEFGELLAVAGRDDAGEAPLVTLAARVTASVDRDRTLLTEREKQQFEQHILGELGDTIRRCRRDAEELVTAMNQLLGTVTTSQGIRMRLKWDLREDIPAEARDAVGLLAQPVGALLPEERASLRDALHQLIEASRAERPELAYSEHLAAALDYRTWSEFTIRYTRPEKLGTWERLHRRSALSQGEQKVLCYLPLFAAAAAHFTSLAGAAPYAPRLVLLDDAFPKIDVRTHPLLFGLLVQLDLDFVITSERLWGCHETVPSLAIYEALRDPTQRGIAQYESRWDGRALHSLG